MEKGVREERGKAGREGGTKGRQRVSFGGRGRERETKRKAGEG